MAWRRRARLAHHDLGRGPRRLRPRRLRDARGIPAARRSSSGCATAVLAHAAPAREMLQGDTITRRIAVDPEFIAAVPEIKALLANPDWRGLNRYVGSFDQEPLTYVQTILSHVRNAKPDPQTDLHIRHVSSDGEGLLFPDRRGGGRGAVRLRAGLAPADAEAARVGVRAEHRRRRERRPALRARLAARHAPRISSDGICARRAPSPCPPTRWSSPTPSASTRAAFPPARRVRVEIWTYGRQQPVPALDGPRSRQPARASPSGASR